MALCNFSFVLSGFIQVLMDTETRRPSVQPLKEYTDKN